MPLSKTLIASLQAAVAIYGVGIALLLSLREPILEYRKGTAILAEGFKIAITIYDSRFIRRFADYFALR